MLTAVDYALIVIVLVSMGIGLWRGLVVEVLSLTVWIAAFWLSMAFGGDVATRFSAVESVTAQWFLGYASVFLATLILGGLAIWLIGKLLAGSGLSSADRLLGLMFGLLRGYALCCVAVLGLGFTPLPQERWWQDSRLMPGFVLGAGWLQSFLPAKAAAQNHLSLES